MRVVGLIVGVDEKNDWTFLAMRQARKEQCKDRKGIKNPVTHTGIPSEEGVSSPATASELVPTGCAGYKNGVKRYVSFRRPTF